ncbi:MAG: hypothetical protein V4702_04215 [Patescibacteria group bacterium]
MPAVLWIIVISAILIFSFVIAFGAPYLPTLRARTPEALDLLDLKPGQTLLELGSGDGRILRAAAERGIKSIGYELNPLLVIWSKGRHWKYHKLITVHWGNYWRHKLPVTDGIYVFLLNQYMEKLNNKIEQEITKPVKLVSFAFAIPGKKPVKELNGLMLYEYKPRSR